MIERKPHMTVSEIVRDELVPDNDPYPLPSESGVYDVTPEMASSWFSYRRHPKLRRFSPSTSARYQADMLSGRWQEATPEGLIFDTDGWIISAQHRLKAQANAGLTLKWRIFVNEPRDISSFLDQGRRRSASDLLMVKYGTQVGAGARHLAALKDRDQFGMPRYNAITVPEVVATYQQWPELGWHLTEVVGCQYDADIPAAPHLAVIAQVDRTEYREEIAQWLHGVRTGQDLRTGDPRLHLRNRFRGGLTTLGKTNKRDQAYALIVKAWNAYATGESLHNLRWNATEDLPTVIGYDWDATEEKKSA